MQIIYSSDVIYNNTSGITDSNGDEITDVQAALNELYDRTDGGGSSAVLPSFEFNTHGGNQIENQEPDRYNISTLPTPTKEGYNFVGWYDAETGGNKITSGTILAEGTILHAHWQSFAYDSWETIKANIIAGNTSGYHVGDTRSITLIGTGDLAKTVNIRVANNSNYDCTLGSKTACGFVVEFEDIITTHQMKSSNTNSGGWPDTSMRSWLNSTVLAALPTDLQNVIATTTVVSGHESGKYSDYSSQDKLYLLSQREVWDCTTSCTDSAYSSSRQLDYYAIRSVTENNNYSAAIKKKNGTAESWWLRSTSSNSTDIFRYALSDGNHYYQSPSVSFGVAPAFRISN